MCKALARPQGQWRWLCVFENSIAILQGPLPRRNKALHVFRRHRIPLFVLEFMHLANVVSFLVVSACPFVHLWVRAVLGQAAEKIVLVSGARLVLPHMAATHKLKKNLFPGFRFLHKWLCGCPPVPTSFSQTTPAHHPPLYFSFFVNQ